MVIRRLPRAGALLPLLLAALLAGCMYPGAGGAQGENARAVREELERVASAVAGYYEKTGVYPIVTADASVPVYEKYAIDLGVLVRTGFLNALPRNAFESGGVFSYLLVHPETDPIVMLMDLTAVQQTGDLQREIDEYLAGNGGTLPILFETAPNFFAIDYDKLQRKPLYIRSRYSNQYLPVLLHASGRVLIDYSLDIMQAVQEAAGDPPNEGDDVRERLVKVSPYSPVKSFPYVWRGGEPHLSEP